MICTQPFKNQYVAELFNFFNTPPPLLWNILSVEIYISYLDKLHYSTLFMLNVALEHCQKIFPQSKYIR